MGRPTKLNSQTVLALERALRAGATYEIACMSAGIAYSTYRSWVVRAEEIEKRQEAYPDDEPTEEEKGFLEFLEAVKKAEGETAVRNLAIISMTAQGRTGDASKGIEGAAPVWTAAAWLLERRYPAMYGRQVQEIKHGGGVTVNHIPPEEIASLDRQIDEKLQEWEESELGSEEGWDREPDGDDDEMTE